MLSIGLGQDDGVSATAVRKAELVDAVGAISGEIADNNARPAY